VKLLYDLSFNKSWLYLFFWFSVNHFGRKQGTGNGEQSRGKRQKAKSRKNFYPM